MALTLKQVWKEITEQLIQAKNDRKHPFRLPVIGTVGKDVANMRTVVLRDIQTQPLILTCYTDLRSQKIKDLQKTPTLTWLFWHPHQQVQIKASGKITIEHQTSKTKVIWKDMHFGAKLSYLTLSAPGVPSDNATNGLPLDYSEATAATATDDNFCMIHCTIDTLEWLRLDRLAHRRVRFKLHKNEWQGVWLVP